MITSEGDDDLPPGNTDAYHDRISTSDRADLKSPLSHSQPLGTCSTVNAECLNLTPLSSAVGNFQASGSSDVSLDDSKVDVLNERTIAAD